MGRLTGKLISPSSGPFYDDDLPLALGLLIAAVMDKTMRDPPVTRDMLRILDHDHDVDGRAAAGQLGISLTGLDDTLRCMLLPAAG